ncbi:similar to Saccharomyces cerevisiae YGR162W TIF4631 Translation initiation factor eIF4G, subunit of the mRNA cap-binding protein complex (eIF4F) that also contains eIF4E (Cdc33p) [Maudiozyma saulgeensis]|uniref:Similar to Saccharomyces cerevisiae YGR162W TIF4631 Translation initiation factor eIF4G, subunit of the mRNA cap-binding protein complex (eIF4F) that also contains eIF4E (Cdc33p) n=1 Tax=Maudiozyma saulgeensis TaxID=1789683 RepID=A0A1X7R5Z5_9SACH|nr:similar to Saccharomyces cerevisiae YGR162W TIF4631 Translation initiation factor eIF4G, subunit of the mRNA cap-binding protein complex (eIF4F) that also contains eIF4E (Cdc33p) [Kazachstania saulgeensis]
MASQETVEQSKGQTVPEQPQSTQNENKQQTNNNKSQVNSNNNYSKQNRFNAGSNYYKPNMQWQQQKFYNGYPAYNPMQPQMGMNTPAMDTQGSNGIPTKPTVTAPVNNEEELAAKAKAEQTRKSFVEEVKRRKAEIERKKQEQEALKKVAEEDKLKEEAEARTKMVEEAKIKADALAKARKEEEGNTKTEEEIKTDSQPIISSPTTDNSTNNNEEQKVMTFAERMKLKKLQKGSEEGSSESITDSTDDKKTLTNNEEEINEEKLVEPTEAAETTEPKETIVSKGTTDATTDENESKSNKVETSNTEVDPNAVTISDIIKRISEVPPITNIFEFKYPEGINGPEEKYQKETVKYTYGPAFLLQFQTPLKVVADAAWMQSTGSKIVIPPGMNRNNRSRDPSKFGGRGGDFRSNSTRDGSNSRNSSKRKSRKDDRRSNRSYTSRRDRERNSERNEDKKEDKPKEEVAPLVPTANRWVPKSRAKKTEKKFAPDGVTELFEKPEIESKMKSLLNKLTLEKFDTISVDILDLANLSRFETDGSTLKTVIEQVFLKACDEPHWSSMYAQLCGKVVKELDPEIADETNEGRSGPKLVLHYLVDRCHTEFQKGWTDKLPTNEDGSPLEPEMMSDEYYQAAAAKRRGLGLVRFIGYLYRLNLLSGKMMFECFRRLMKDLNDNPSEDVLESVVELLDTVGEQFETDSFNAGPAVLEGSALLDSLFSIISSLVKEDDISNRMKFKLLDIIELREEKNWNNGKKDAGPKTIQQIHEEDERERALKMSSRQNSRRGNNSNRNNSRRDQQSASYRDKDNFVTTRSFSQRNNQKPQPAKEEVPAPTAASNMFSALMNQDEEDE